MQVTKMIHSNYALMFFRYLHLLFAIAITAIAAWLIHGQKYGHPPNITSYSLFAGCLGLLTGLFGVFLIHHDAARPNSQRSIPTKMALYASLCTVLVYFCGGIAIFIQMRNLNCRRNDFSSQMSLTYSEITSGGCTPVNHSTPRCAYSDDMGALQSRCQASSSNGALMITAAVISVFSFWGSS